MQSESEWCSSWLWNLLSKRANSETGSTAERILSKTREWLEIVTQVLASGGTSPNDFTLHDEKHSQRVASRMEEILSENVKESISDYEIALLLLSAYCHDVGMTPHRKKVKNHYTYLLSGSNSGLNKFEIEEFRKYLDALPDGPIEIPLSRGAPTISDLNLAEELTAFYVREKHNDWSEEWIRENLSGELFGFPNSREILIRVCRSHHLGFEDLKDTAFNPIPVGSPGQLVHVRYLACVLRIADILENDPERTPEIIFRHRNIEERKRSVIFWLQDHDAKYSFVVNL